MKLLLIGHTVKDTIRDGNRISVKPGGLYYSAIAMRNLITPKDEIFLLTSFDTENFELLEEVYSDFNLDFAEEVEKMPGIRLTLYENKERKEEYENISGKLSLEKLFASNIDFDGILVNMITGFDISAEDIQKLREKYKGKIYLDVHSLSRGMNERKERFFRKIPDAQKWYSAADIIQSNEYEIFTLSEETEEIKIAEQVLSDEGKMLIKTMGRVGARAYFRDRGEIASAFVTAIKSKALNQVGCGDVFGTAFFYSYISQRDLLYSLRFANVAAGVVTEYEKFEDYKKLKNDIAKRFY
jgi:hypothetical protein